jgi:acetyltransferase
VTVEAGPTVTLRPIRPEDEPAWMQMLGRCSKETIYARFRYFFQWASHEAAVRYCFTDYEREIAIVVEQEEEGERSLLGVGRLVADPNHESGEYAALIVDEWQNRGLGGILLDYCEQIARAWGLKRMVAQTTADNYRMVAQFRNRGFAVELDTDGQTMQVVKELGPKASAGRADA